MTELEGDEHAQAGMTYAVGYKRPPLHTRFQPGQSGNPSGRRRGSENLKTLLEKILCEEIALQEGNVTKTISKAEAVLRKLVISALKGETRSQQTLFRLAEQIGQLEEERPAPITSITRIIVDPRAPRSHENYSETIPAITQPNRE